MKTRLGLLLLLVAAMAGTPDGLSAQQDPASVARRRAVWSGVVGYLWVSDEDAGDRYLGGLHVGFLAPRRFSVDLALLIKPLGGDAPTIASDFGLAYPVRFSTGSVLVPRVGVSELIVLPEYAWSGTHLGLGLIIPDQVGSAAIRLDAVLLRYAESSAVRMTIGISSLPDWFER